MEEDNTEITEGYAEQLPTRQRVEEKLNKLDEVRRSVNKAEVIEETFDSLQKELVHTKNPLKRRRIKKEIEKKHIELTIENSTAIKKLHEYLFVLSNITEEIYGLYKESKMQIFSITEVLDVWIKKQEFNNCEEDINTKKEIKYLKMKMGINFTMRVILALVNIIVIVFLLFYFF